MEDATTVGQAGAPQPLIRYSWTQGPRWQGVVFDSEQRFDVRRVLDFASAELEHHSPVVYWVPPEPTWVRRDKSVWNVPYPAVEGHWRAYALWGEGMSTPILDHRTRTLVYWVSIDHGEWIPVTYRQAFDSCVFVQHMSYGERACDECALRGERCEEEWMTPWLARLAEKHGHVVDHYAVNILRGERTAWMYSEDREEARADVKKATQPGFEWVEPRLVLPDVADNPFFPKPRDNCLPLRMNFDDYVISQNQKEVQRIRDRATATRMEHNATCGFKKERCMFRDWECRRWRSRHCSRRWFSTGELVEAGLARWRALHGEIPMRDLQFAARWAGEHVQMRSSHTGHLRECVYRGVIRDGDELHHVFHSARGYYHDEEYRGTFDDVLRHMRRNAPEEQGIWTRWWKEARDVKIMDEGVLMMLELAEEEWFDGRVILSTRYSEGRSWSRRDGKVVEGRPTLHVWAQYRSEWFHSIEEVMMDPRVGGWPAWSGIIPG